MSYMVLRVSRPVCSAPRLRPRSDLALTSFCSTIPYDLPSISFDNEFFSSYAFASLTATFLVIYGDTRATNIGCVSSVVTPDLGNLAGLIRWLPLAILILVGFATMFAGVFSPWGTTDVFRWTSNSGRDADLLRLVTPGFGDCLQYLQFAVLTGGLTLDYPGFYRPVVSQAAWSVLMFNESLASNKPGWQAVQDGIYVTNGTHGLQQLAQLTGIPDVEDIWVGMIVWLLVIIALVLVFIQLGFCFRWAYRLVSSTAEEDLRAKNLPFTIGNVIRIVFNYFLLPIVALSAFQLVVAGESAAYAVALASITLVVLIVFVVWLLFLIVTTRPRAVLFDDLPTVLLYGPLYNTYSDEAATFALVPILLTFFRGIAIGAVQPVGIAQIVILAICEVINVLTIHAFHPYSSPTSMNAYHTLFSALRFITVMLMVAFIPELGVTEGPKGWIGYAILILHGGVLALGFLLNTLQTIVEVTARLMGVRGEDGLARGGLAKIFGMRQLQQRMPKRASQPSRQSQLSSTAMLDADEVSKAGYPMRKGRVRSESAGSAVLLRNHNRNSSALDSIDAYSVPPKNLDNASAFTPTTPGATPGAEASTLSFLPSPGAATRAPAVPAEAADPYYRPPRRRGDTLTDSISLDQQRASLTDSRRYSQLMAQPADGGDVEGQAGQTVERSQTPAPAPINLQPRADYSTREVDFYYGVRGPALNSEGPGRKLGTGPADPTGPMASAAGWFRTMLGGKTKEKGKGFEVVRSSRMPSAMRAADGEPHDETPPEGILVAMGVLRKGPIDSDDDDEPTRETPRQQDDLLTGESNGQEEESDDEDASGFDARVSAAAPILPGFEFGDGFNVPSRIPSKASRQPSQKQKYKATMSDTEYEIPDIPRKSSKRHSGQDFAPGAAPAFNLVPPSSPPKGQRHAHAQAQAQGQGQRRPSPVESARSVATSSRTRRLPFERTNSQKRLSGSSMDVTEELSQVDLNDLPSDREERPTSFGYVPQHNINRVDPDQERQVDLLGTSAELVEEPLSSGGNSRKGRSF